MPISGERDVGEFFRKRSQRRVQDGQKTRDRHHNRETLLRSLAPDRVRVDEAFGLSSGRGGALLLPRTTDRHRPLCGRNLDGVYPRHGKRRSAR